MSKLQGLLSDPRFLEFSLGLLAQSGSGVDGLAQAIGRSGLSAFGTQSERLHNEEIRRQLVEQERRRAAFRQLPGLLETTTVQGPDRNFTIPGVEGLGDTDFSIPSEKQLVPLLATPEGQQRLMGLLSVGAPEDLAATLFNQLQPQQQRAEPADIRTFRILNPNLDIGTPEGRELFFEFKRQQSPGDDLDELFTRTQIEINQSELARQRAEREDKQESEQKVFASSEIAINRSLDILTEAADLNEKLASTLLATGGLGLELRAKAKLTVAEVKGLFGTDVSQDRLEVDRFNRFKKLTSKIIIDEIGNISGSGQGQVTNQRLTLLADALGGLGTTPQPNNLIFADSIETLLDTADIEGFSVKRRQSLEELILRLRAIARPAQNVDTGNGFSFEVTNG